MHESKHNLTRLSFYTGIHKLGITLDDQNSRSGNMIGATRDQINRPVVAQLVTIRTQTDAQPTSTNFPLSPTEVDQPVRSMAEYILASEKIKWKKEYEYVTGFDFSSSSRCSSVLSNGSKGFPEPSNSEATGQI